MRWNLRGKVPGCRATRRVAVITQFSTLQLWSGRVAWLGACGVWGEGRARVAIDVRGRERSRVCLCAPVAVLYDVSG